MWYKKKKKKTPHLHYLDMLQKACTFIFLIFQRNSFSQKTLKILIVCVCWFICVGGQGGGRGGACNYFIWCLPGRTLTNSKPEGKKLTSGPNKSIHLGQCGGLSMLACAPCQK